jgi:hypothetical protein
MDSTVPIVVLAGSDRKAPVLPDAAHDEHPIAGYKGLDVRIADRPLAALVVERVSAVRSLGPVHLVGPARAFGSLAGARTRLIDSDGSFGENIRAAVRGARAERPEGPLAFITCDVLPEVAALESLVEEYRRGAPYDLWFPLVRFPEDERRLGASAWKPFYRMAPHRGEPAVRLLPGHFVIADPEALRLDFLYRLFDLGYRTRNRPIAARRGVMVRGVLAGLLIQDLRNALTLRAPTLTWTVLVTGIAAARKLYAEAISRTELEDALRRIFVRARHRRLHPRRRVALPIVDALSLALDIDTEEEARALGAELRGRAGC